MTKIVNSIITTRIVVVKSKKRIRENIPETPRHGYHEEAAKEMLSVTVRRLLDLFGNLKIVK